MKKTIVPLLSLTALLIVGCTSSPSSSSVSTVTSSSSSSNSTTSSSSTSSSSSSSSSSTTVSTVEQKPTLSITTVASSLWYDETLQMEASFSKSYDSEIEWSTSDETVATLSPSGLLTPLKAGKVDVIAKAKKDATITAKKEITVKDVIIDTTYGAGNYDYTNLKAEVPSITTTKVNAPWPYAETVFKNIYGKRYYAEATFHVSETNYDWTWNRISLGHRDRVEKEEDHIFRGLQLSYGDSSSNQKKTVMMETPNTWGDTTDRSQVWGQNKLSSIDFTNVKLATLRDQNTYYYYINDALYWMESMNTRFQNTDTMPAIVVGDMHATIDRMMATTEESVINEKLNSNETKRKYYTSFDNIDVLENSSKFVFKNNNDQWPFNNIKDNWAKSLGDAASIPARTSATITFDVAFQDFGADANAARLGVNFHRYQNGPAETRSLLLSKFICGLTAWNSNGDLPNSIGVEKELAAAMKADTAVSVEIKRTIDGNKQIFDLKVADKDYNIQWSEEYVEALTLSIGAVRSNVTVSNFTVQLAN